MDEKPAKIPPPAPETNPPPHGGSEASGVAVDRPSAALRIGLIALVALGVAALGFHEAKFLPKLPRFPFFSGPRGVDLTVLPDGFPVLPGDVALVSEPVILNGRRIDSVRFASERPPASVMREYVRRLRPLGYSVLPGKNLKGHPGGRFVGFKGEGQAMLAFRDTEGRFMGIVAFGNPATGGSDYYITVDEDARDDGVSRSMEVDGRDPPGVMRPPSSTREYCIERGGPSPSVMALYRSEAVSSMVARLYRARMPDQGWIERSGAREAFRHSEGGVHLLFEKGNEQCLVNVAPAGEEGYTWVTLAYRSGSR